MTPDIALARVQGRVPRLHSNVVRDRRRTLPGSLACLAATALAVAAALAATPSGAEGQSGKFQRDGGTGTGFLGECALLRDDDAKLRCYERRLLAEVEASGDPASELPRIDRRARSGGPFLVANCHTLMHEVGRRFAKRRGVTLGNMQRYVPRSNDPGCSAGFGMGMVMHLGPQIARFGGDGGGGGFSPSR